MTEKFKYVKIISFAAIVISLALLLSEVILPESENVCISKYGKAKMWAMNERENSIDAFFLGDSEVYASVSPLELWDKYGYSTYDCSHSAIKSYEAYDFLASMLSQQNPKIVFIEANFLYRNYNFSYIIYDRISERLSLFEYHDLWKKLVNPNQEYEKTYNYSYKGYLLNKKSLAANNTQYMVKTDSAKNIPQKNLDYFDKMYKLCKEKNIEVVLFNAPSRKNWNYQKHNGIAGLAEKYEIDYIDLNIIDIGIDWSKDTRDRGDHLNQNGAVKVTQYLGNYLHEKNILDDRRDDSSYSDWNELLNKYKANI